MIDHCIITGAGSGIGRAIALRLAKRGVPLLLVGRLDSITETRDQIQGSVDLFPCDLADHASHQSALAAVVAAKRARRWGVVLAASMLDPKGAGSTSSDYELVFNVNLAGNLAVLEACLPHMIENKSGRALFFAGGGAAYAYPPFPAYALSKVSTVRLVENLAAIHPPATGCSFVCLAPGAVDTPMLAKVIAAGGEVKTKTTIDEPVGFAESYFASESTALSGRYIHVRDDWNSILSGALAPTRDQFFLRRIQ
jgi:NAD(P)-dependent dehydrogenase (short-subunit alcohol dehydrogenase family)